MKTEREGGGGEGKGVSARDTHQPPSPYSTRTHASAYAHTRGAGWYLDKVLNVGHVKVRVGVVHQLVELDQRIPDVHRLVKRQILGLAWWGSQVVGGIQVGESGDRVIRR